MNVGRRNFFSTRDGVAMARRGNSSAEYLFSDYDMHGVQQAQRVAVKKAVEDIRAEEFGATEIEDLTAAFVDRFRLDPPTLTEGAISVDVEEAQVDVTGDFSRGTFGRGPHLVPGIRASYFVPFTGDRQMFKVRPNT